MSTTPPTGDAAGATHGARDPLDTTGAPETDSPEPPEDASRNPQAAARASAIMAAGTLISRVLGFIRTSLLAIAIGSTALVADVFESANTIPNIIYMLLAGGVFNVVLVPQLIKAARAPDRGADYTSRLITLAIIIMAAFTIAITACAYPIMSALTLNWSEPKLALATAFALWTLPQIFFYGLYAIIGQVLNAHGRFGGYMWAPVANNAVAIIVIGVYLLMFGHYTGIDGSEQLAEWTTTHTLVLAGGHTLGIVVQALVLFWPLKRLGLGLRLKFGWKGMGLRTTGRLAAFTLITMVVGNLGNLIGARLVTGATEARSLVGESPEASAAVPGLYALNVTQLITVLPHSVFVLSIATVLFNQLARSMHEKRIDEARETTGRGLRIFAVPMMFAMVVMIVLAGPLGRIFAGSSETAAISAAAIGQLLVLLALGMPFRSAHFYLLRVFYAAENAFIPMLVQVSAAVVTLALAYGIAPFIPNTSMAYLLALTYTVVHVLQFLVCHLLVRRTYGDYGSSEVFATYLRTGYAAVLSGLAGAGVLWLLGGFSTGFAWQSIITALISCAAVGIVMLVVYLIVCRWLRIREVDQFLAPLLSRLSGRRS